jgi:hypothetical protein
LLSQGFPAIVLRHYGWRATVVLAGGSISIFGFYVLNLYANNVSILLPGVTQDDLESVYNVRYGSVMAATIPLFAALFFFELWQAQRRRTLAFFILAPLVLPDPIPKASHESMDDQFTGNLFYREAIHNQKDASIRGCFECTESRYRSTSG